MNTLVRKKKSFLQGRSKEQVERELVSLLLKNSTKVEAAYIFGSFNSTKFNSDSDLDLLLVIKTEQNFIERPLQFTSLDSLKIPIDLIIYTPEEFAKIIAESPKVGFWKSFFNSAKKII